MKDHYDFNKGSCGQFYAAEVAVGLPVYLAAQVDRYLAAKADAKGVDLSELVNDLLEREIAIIEAVK